LSQCVTLAVMNILAKHIQSQPHKPMRVWAEEFGISRPHLINLMDGSRAPSLAVALRIQVVTNGAVPITAWANLAAVVRAAEGNAA